MDSINRLSLTFQGSSELKNACLNRIHKREPLFQGYGTPSIAIWAPVPKESQDNCNEYFASNLGFGPWFAVIVSNIFEMMPKHAASNWPSRLFRAIPVGVDSHRIYAYVISTALTHNGLGILSLCNDYPEYREMISETAECWDRLATGKDKFAKIESNLIELHRSANNELDSLQNRRTIRLFNRYAVMMTLAWASLGTPEAASWTILCAIPAHAGRLDFFTHWYVRITQGQEALCGAWYTRFGVWDYALRSKHERLFHMWSERLIEIMRTFE